MFSLPAVSVMGVALAAITVVFVVLRRIEAGRFRSGWVLGLLGFVALPMLVLLIGGSYQMKQAGTTEFCLSCHEMKPYGQSLLIDDPDQLQAAHYQNKRIPRDRACYSCHTSYTMFGGVSDKLRGARHVLKHFFPGDNKDAPFHLYDPFLNRECLHCHAGARTFEESEYHEDVLEDLKNETISCLDCHYTSHGIETLDEQTLWEEEVAE